MLVELIYRGLLSALSFDFLRQFLDGAKEVRFDFPEIDSGSEFDEVMALINANDYVDLVINTNVFLIKDRVVPRVFINIGRDGENIEVFLFFDALDLKEPSEGTSIDYLWMWAKEFSKDYNFNYFICQFDNANEDEYYFDINGTGKLYK